MDNNIILSPVSFDKLLEALFQKVMEAIRNEQKEQLQEKLLTAKEVAQLFSVSVVTISSWVSKGLLTKYSIGGRTKFKYSEVMKSLKTIKKYGKI